MTDIQSSQSALSDIGRFGTLNRSASEIGTISEVGADKAVGAVYTYIGISEPERDKTHLYENQSIIDAQKSKYTFDPKRHNEM